MIGLFLVIGIVLCAVQTIRSPRLLFSALWLGCTSAFLSVLLYVLGAREIAVIELSIGAGLITVLLVFVLNLTGESTTQQRLLPGSLALAMTGLIVALLALFIFPLPAEKSPAIPLTTLSAVLWRDRSLDVLMQSILIFAGALSVLGLLAEAPPKTMKTPETTASPITTIQVEVKTEEARV